MILTRVYVFLLLLLFWYVFMLRYTASVRKQLQASVHRKTLKPQEKCYNQVSKKMDDMLVAKTYPLIKEVLLDFKDAGARAMESEDLKSVNAGGGQGVERVVSLEEEAASAQLPYEMIDIIMGYTFNCTPRLSHMIDLGSPAPRI